VGKRQKWANHKPLNRDREKNRMKILVTGGAGFIGSHLVDALLARGHDVRVFDSLDPQVHAGRDQAPVYLDPQAEFIRGDVRDRSALDAALEGIDVVYHQAAAVGVGQSMYEIKHYMEVNTVGTAVLLEAMLPRRGQFKKLVVASSMSIYGEGRYQTKAGEKIAPKLRPVSQFKEGIWELRDPEDGQFLIPLPTDEEKSLQPASPYASGKRDQEEMCLSIGRAYGIPTVALRYFNVYGQRQALSNPYTGIAAIFTSRLLNDHAPLVFEDGLQSRDFTHVSDIVQANILAMDHATMDYEYFNVGTGRRLTVLDVATSLAKAMKKDLPPKIVSKFREGDSRHCYADISKIRKAAGYSPTVTFEQGIAELVDWCRTQSAEDKVLQAAQELSAKGLTK
jgi:dTDP-L-rhamnose 4-epimerase